MGLLQFLNKAIPPPAPNSPDRLAWEKADGYVSACLNATLSLSVAYIAIGTNSASELITEYCDLAKRLADSLKAAGESITDSTLVLQVLQGLNPIYNMFVLNVENSSDPPSFHQLKSKLLIYEARLAQQNTQPVPFSAMAALHTTPPHQNSLDRNVVCQICEKSGHKAINCHRFTSSQWNSGGRGSGNNRWRGNSGGRFNRGGGNNRGGRYGGNQWNSGGRGASSMSGGGSQWSYGGSQWPATSHVANLAYNNSTMFQNKKPSFASGGSNYGDDYHPSLSSFPGQPNPSQQSALSNSQGILGSGPKISCDPSTSAGFGSNGPNSFADSTQFGPSHFNSWATTQTTPHFGLSATVSDICHTVESWIPDSGATAHMTSDVTMVHDAVSYTGSEQVIVGNDSSGANPPPHAA